MGKNRESRQSFVICKAEHSVEQEEISCMIISKDKLKQPKILAAFFAFFGGILIHLFALANVVHNSDDIASHPSGYGVGVASGRWLLTIMGDFLIKQKMNYNLTQ